MGQKLRAKFKILKQSRCRVPGGHQWMKWCYRDGYRLDFILENCVHCDLKRGRILSVNGTDDTLFIRIVQA